MKKYIEQRIEELELEVKLLKAKVKLNEKTDTSKYINNYNNFNAHSDYNASMCNPGVNLMSMPDLETAFSSPFDSTETKNTPLDTITVKIPTCSDADIDSISVSQRDLFFEKYNEYPEIDGSWDSGIKDITDEYGFKLNLESTPFTSWGFLSEFDKMDKDFLEWCKTDNAKKAFEDSNRELKSYENNTYRPFKVK